MSSRMRTSEMSGTFSIRHLPETSNVAGRMATTAFFAPEMTTSPFSGVPPMISYFAKEILSLHFDNGGMLNYNIKFGLCKVNP